MDVKEFNVPLKRSSVDLCFYGDKGSGKTLVMTYYAFCEYCKGKTVYSNYNLNFPHKRIESLDMLSDMSNCCFVGDDFESWLSSKFRSNKEKAGVLEASLNFGKRNVSPFLWSCKRPLEIDKTLRYTVDYFVHCNFVLKYDPVDIVDYECMSRFLDAHVVVLDVFNAVSMKLEKTVVVDNLDLWCELYDTVETVKKLMSTESANTGRRANISPDGEYCPTRNPPFLSY